MQGQDVKNAQNVLLMAGNDDVKPEAEDAVYGEKTAAKIAVFQENRGIVERGVGPKTWAALRDYAH
jgi:peptidoglycan hydrolase-like protein with peptidoglycan-binding domain